MSNRLAEATSPYLRQHADNPVDWHPWGAEAFEEAQRRDVPLLISIGYSTCHWCHVMARESFSDEAIASAVNRDFVAIKVDREEHPDVDSAYMAAASAFTQNLGWPLTVFATPAGRAFHAGTYFPPVARGGMPAFRDVLAAVREAWDARREAVVERADAVASALSQIVTEPAPLPTHEQLEQAAAAIAAREDRVHGGFGTAPKFPVATTLRFLQTVGSAEIADRALAAMAASELRDDDGGFFRYTTQRDWTVPHYERMLTDNAQLLDVALDAGREDVARGVARFLIGVLRRDGGGFGAAQDSESWIDGERREGGYYQRPVAARAGLEPPAVDGKVITGWNGLAIGALARAGARLGESAWIAAAADAASFVLSTNRSAAGRLVRTSLDGVASDAVATAADLGLLADGLFALALATGEASWAASALRLLDEPVDDDPVLAAQGIPFARDESDADMPSGTAALAAASLTAWRLGAGSAHLDRATELVSAVSARALEQPFAFGSLLRVAVGLASPPRQIVVVDGSAELADAARRTDADVVAVVTAAQVRAFADAGFELFAGRDGVPGVAYDCREFVCALPTSDPTRLDVARD